MVVERAAINPAMARRQGQAPDSAAGSVEGERSPRDVRVIETRCMGICPKRAVTALNASRPDKIIMIPKGNGAE
jgi:hypothetical protein